MGRRCFVAGLTLLSAVACGRENADSRTLAIEGIQPSCPIPGSTIAITLKGGVAQRCDGGAVRLGDLDLVNLGLSRQVSLVLTARLPWDFRLPEAGVELRVSCAGVVASTPWFTACSEAGSSMTDDGGALAPPHPDAAAACGQPIQAVIEAVDKFGHPFARDADGVYLIPIKADDFALDTGRSSNVSGRDVSYTFGSDCYPMVTVQAPVLGGLGTDGLWLQRICHFTIEIRDAGCTDVRTARADASFQIVP